SLFDWARNLAVFGQPSNAEPALKRVIKFYRDAGVARRQNLVDALLTLGKMYQVYRHYKEASPLLTEALSLARDDFGPNDWMTLQAMHELALLRSVTGRWPESEALLLECLSVARKIHLDDNHPDVVDVENDLGELYSDWGRPADAENYLRQSLQGYRKY